jgi:hypothetical protein
VAHGEEGSWSFGWQKWRLKFGTCTTREKEVEPVTSKMEKGGASRWNKVWLQRFCSRMTFMMEAFGAASRCLGRGGRRRGSRASMDSGKELGLEAADGWKIRAEVLARDASRLGMATVMRDGSEAAWLRLGPAMAGWSGGAALDDRLKTGCMGGPAPATNSAGMRRNCSGRRPWHSAEWKGEEGETLGRTG